MARAKAAQAAERAAEARTEAQRAAAPAKDAADATKPPPPPPANAAEDPAKDAADPAAPPPVKVRKPYTITKQRERWTDAEHQRFIEALDLYGRQWRKIEEYVGTKTAVQIRSHAQKFFSKLEKEGHTSGSMVTRNGIGFSIPPPRPKKRPAHPYPKKAGNTGKAAEAAKKARKAAAPAPETSPSGCDVTTGGDGGRERGLKVVQLAIPVAGPPPPPSAASAGGWRVRLVSDRRGLRRTVAGRTRTAGGGPGAGGPGPGPDDRCRRPATCLGS